MIKKYLMILIIIVSFYIVVSCTTSKIPEVLIEADEVEVSEIVPMLEFTDEEMEYINKLKEKGYLSIATEITPFIYTVDAEGKIEGFHYNLIASFAESIGVSLSIKLVSFSDYFKFDGAFDENIFTDDTISYTPDLFNEVDLYVDTISILPWRERIMRFIPVIATRQVLLKNVNLDVDNIKELDGKTVSVVKLSSHYQTFLELEEEYDITFKYLFVDEYYDMTNNVSMELADIAIMDINEAIFEVRKYDNIRIFLPVKEVEMLSWAVAKDNLLLQSVLNKYIKYSKETNVFNNSWEDTYEISINEYLLILGSDENSDEEGAVND